MTNTKRKKNDSFACKYDPKKCLPYILHIYLNRVQIGRLGVSFDVVTNRFVVQEITSGRRAIPKKFVPNILYTEFYEAGYSCRHVTFCLVGFCISISFLRNDFSFVAEEERSSCWRHLVKCLLAPSWTLHNNYGCLCLVLRIISSNFRTCTLFSNMQMKRAR